MSMRFLTQYKPAGTISFRQAASKRFKFGNNAQNVAKPVLQMFIPDEGMELFQADQAGAEAKIVAYEAEAGNLRALFEEGIKPHVFVALHLFIEKFRGKKPATYYTKCPVRELKKLPEWKELYALIKNSGIEYDLGKRTCHASNYCQGPNTFRMKVLEETDGQLLLSLEEATLFLSMYKVLFPEVVAWQERTARRIQDTKLLRNLFGFPRFFARQMTDSYIRDAISWVPQSTVGTLTNIAMTELQDFIDTNKRNWIILNNKHDSLLVEGPSDEAGAIRATMCGFLEKELVSTLGVKYKMGTEFQRGMNWGKCSEKNPHGMKEV